MKYYRLQNHLFHEGSFTLEVFDPATETWHRAGEIHPFRDYYQFRSTVPGWLALRPEHTPTSKPEHLAAAISALYAREFLQPKPAIATGAAQPSLF